MRSPTASLKYARALAEVCGDSDRQDQVLDQLENLRELFNSHDQLWKTLSNPSIPFSVKRTIIEKLCKRLSLDQLVINFLSVVLENARINQFQEIIESYQTVLERKRGILTVYAYTARRISSSLKKRIEKTICVVTGKQVKLKYQVDESLVGGIMLRIGSTVIDGSIQTQLSGFYQQAGYGVEHGN